MKNYLIFAPGEDQSYQKYIGKGPPTLKPGFIAVEIPEGQEGRDLKSFRLVDGRLVDYVEPPIIPKEPMREEKLALEYQQRLGGFGNQVDAIYKLAQILLPALDRADILTPEEKQALTPDKDAPPDTPAGWLGIVGDVKARNPKPAKEAP